MSKIKTYIDYLQDDQFIQWQLTKDIALDKYWDSYLRENPMQKEELMKAIEAFKQIKIGKENIDSADRQQLLATLTNSLEKNKKHKTTIRYISILSAIACLALLLLVNINYFNTKEQENNLIAASNNTILGEELNSEDIHLITSGGTQSFKDEINLALTEKGEVTISEKGASKSTTVAISEKVMNKLIVPYGKRSQITLADGSKVWLNSGSELEFPSSFTKKDRRVSIKGEMYIDVARNENKPFIVQTSNLEVTVLGTVFNISAYQTDSKESVTLVRGKVLVSDTHEKFELAPNDMLEFQRDSFTKKKVDTSIHTSWRDGYFQFQDTPMVEVLRKIGRYYNLSFEYDKDLNLEKRTCTGKIYLSENIDNVLATIALLTSTTTERDNLIINIKP